MSRLGPSQGRGRFEVNLEHPTLEELEANAPDFIVHGHPASLAAHLPRLLEGDVERHPWAATVLAAAIHDVWPGDDRARTLLDGAELTFAALDARRGLGFVAFVRANVALAFGDIRAACQHWEKARLILKDGVPTDEALVVGMGLEAYSAGKLRDALALAEEGLALARIRGAAIQEGSASVLVAFFSVACGEFARAETVIDVALNLLSSALEPHEQRDVPLLQAGRGAIASLRADHSTARAAFATALASADDMNLVWQGAIARCMRAEFTASHSARLAIDDAREALAVLDSLGERWWRVAALRALGAASLGLGEPAAAILTLKRLLAEQLMPSERARTLLVLGEAELAAGHPKIANAALTESEAIYRDLDVRYWHARSMVLLARTDPARGAKWYTKALAIDDGDVAYQVLMTGGSRLDVTVLGDAMIHVDGVRCRFATHNAERAVLALALAPKGVLHCEVLGDRLWGDVAPQLLGGRIRTLLWHVRQGLGHSHAWRVTLVRGVVRIDLRGMHIDALQAVQCAQRLLGASSQVPSEPDCHPAGIVEKLRLPLLPVMQYEEWVQDYEASLQRLAERLEKHYDF